MARKKAEMTVLEIPALYINVFHIVANRKLRMGFLRAEKVKKNRFRVSVTRVTETFSVIR